jgi:hypothetical protein
VTKNFAQEVVIDFEYEIGPDLLPIVLCMIAYVLDENLRHVRTIRLWRGEFGTTPPFDIGPDTLIVAYSAWAEMTCFKVLGWTFPVHIFDLHTAYLAAIIATSFSPTSRTWRERNRANGCRMRAAPSASKGKRTSTKSKCRKTSVRGIGTGMGKKRF